MYMHGSLSSLKTFTDVYIYIYIINYFELSIKFERTQSPIVSFIIHTVSLQNIWKLYIWK